MQKRLSKTTQNVLESYKIRQKEESSRKYIMNIFRQHRACKVKKDKVRHTSCTLLA